MTNEEIVTMIQSGMNRKEGIELLYMQNRGLIYKISKPFFQLCDNTVGLEIDDILQDAFLGLLEAVEHWDSEKGTAFMSYAGFYIQKEIRRAYNDKCKRIRFPEYLQVRLNKYNAFVKDYKSDHFGMDPSDNLLQEELELSHVQLKELKRALFISQIVSLDKIVMVDDEEGSTEGELIPDAYDLETDVVDRLYSDEQIRIVWNCVDELPDALRQTIHARYQEDKTYRDISSECGVSHQAISDREKKALKKLREDARIQMLADTQGFLETSKMYKDGFRRFVNTGQSVVEELALKGVEQSIRYKKERSRLGKYTRTIL